MSKYDSYSVPAVRELLEELCPDGVPMAPLRRVAQIHRGKRVTKAQLLDDGQYPVMSGGTTPMGYLDRANQRPNITTVVKYGSAGFVNFITEEFWANDVCYCLQPLDSTTDRYLYHVLKSRQNDLFELRTNAVPPHLPTDAINAFEVPIPHPDVQEKIVDILDMFTDLDTNLNRELKLRETQIEICLGDIFASDEIANSHSVPLGHLLRHIQPGKYQVNSTEYDPSAPTPVLSPGKAFLLGYTDETDGIFEASPDDPAIIFDDFTTNFHWVDFPFKVKSSAMKMLVPRSDDFVFRYAYWAMKTIPYKPTEHQRQWLQTYSRFEIPLPPLDVQERIVDTLDMFTDYTDNLRREIDLRRQQLEYYRGQLLTFPVAE